MRLNITPEMRGPERCPLGKHFTVIPVCASCDQVGKCKPYLELYQNNRRKIIEIILKYVEEHEKYKIGVIMAESKSKPKLYLALMDGVKIATGTTNEIEGIIKQDPKKYSGEIVLFPATGAKVAVITLSLKEAHFTKATLAKVGGKNAT